MTNDIEVDGVTNFGLGGVYRYVLQLRDGNLGIWLENRASKKQWRSEALSKADFVHPANAFLDATPAEYVSCFKQVLNSDLRESEDSKRELISMKSGSLQLNLTMNARLFDTVREATYVFELLPVSVDKIDILESKLRDLQEHQSRTPRADDWLYLESQCELSEDKVQWSGLHANNFKVEDWDKTAVEWLTSGVFSIAVVVSYSPGVARGSIALCKSGVKIQAIPVGTGNDNRWSRRSSFDTTNAISSMTSTLMCIVKMEEGDRLSLVFTGTSPTAPAYLNAMRLGQ